MNKTYNNEIDDRIVYSILKENAINAERSIIEHIQQAYIANDDSYYC